MPLPPADAGTAAAALAARAQARGETACVVVPALDEQDTVGEVVARLHRDLAAGAGLVAEVVVVDGGSVDDTVARAAAAGARIVRQREPGQRPTPRDGKGAALQLGVAATTASLVAFVDADVVDLDTDFVTALLGPLVEESAVLLTKAAYDRPMATTSSPTGGGRVTELVARPLIATFWPELADVVQPLAGEYAARRSLLESLPFVVGYGVELALLVDTLATHGRDAIRQVDLGARAHAHQDLPALGRMATEILQVALDRAAAQGRSPTVPARLRQPVRAREGYVFEEHAVSWAERPALGD